MFYTFSWGSGIHRSQVGYFDASTKTEHLFDYSCVNEELLLSALEGSALSLKTADVDLSSFVEMELTEKSEAGQILFQDNEVELVIHDGYAE